MANNSALFSWAPRFDLSESPATLSVGHLTPWTLRGRYGHQERKLVRV